MWILQYKYIDNSWCSLSYSDYKTEANMAMIIAMNQYPYLRELRVIYKEFIQ